MLKWAMVFGFVSSIFGQVDNLPACSKILSGRGEVSPGSYCCRNRFDKAECVERNVLEDSGFAPNFRVDRAGWTRKVNAAEYLRKADSVASQARIDSVARASDSAEAVAEAAFRKECAKPGNKPKRAASGEYPAIKKYLMKNLKDPGSFRADEWGPAAPAVGTDYCFDVAIRYRAKNGYGGLDVYREVYHFGLGGVIGGADDAE